MIVLELTRAAALVAITAAVLLASSAGAEAKTLHSLEQTGSLSFASGTAEVAPMAAANGRRSRSGRRQASPKRRRTPVGSGKPVDEASIASAAAMAARAFRPLNADDEGLLPLFAERPENLGLLGRRSLTNPSAEETLARLRSMRLDVPAEPRDEADEYYDWIKL